MSNFCVVLASILMSLQLKLLSEAVNAQTHIVIKDNRRIKSDLLPIPVLISQRFISALCAVYHICDNIRITFSGRRLRCGFRCSCGCTCRCTCSRGCGLRIYSYWLLTFRLGVSGGLFEHPVRVNPISDEPNGDEDGIRHSEQFERVGTVSTDAKQDGVYRETTEDDADAASEQVGFELRVDDVEHQKEVP